MHLMYLSTICTYNAVLATEGQNREISDTTWDLQDLSLSLNSFTMKDSTGPSTEVTGADGVAGQAGSEGTA